jgi:hypothetical protein
VFNQNSSSPILLNVAASASGGTNNTAVFNYTTSSPSMTNVSGTAGAGTTSHGLANYFSSAPDLRESTFDGATSQIFNDGTSRTIFSPANVIWVATSGGDFISFSAALASITDASEDNPYVIKVAPGVYSETTGIDLKSYVDIEGSGEGVTFLRGFGSNVDPSVDGSSATVRALGVITVELRNLTVESYGTGKTDGVPIWIKDTTDSLRLTHVTASGFGGGESYGIRTQNASPVLNFVTATAENATTFGYGMLIKDGSSPILNHITASSTGSLQENHGIISVAASPTMNDVTATASGGTDFNAGVTNNAASSPTLTKVSGTASGLNSYGLANFSGSVATVRDSEFTGATFSIINYISSTARIANSLLNGPAYDGNSGLTCVGVYDGGFVALDTACQ